MTTLDLELPSDGRVCTANDLARRLLSEDGSRHLGVAGAGGSIVGPVVRALLRESSRAIAVLVEDGSKAERAADDLRHLLGSDAVLVFDAPDSSPYADVVPDRAGSARRLAALHALTRECPPRVHIVSAPALARRVVPVARVAAHGVHLELLGEYERDDLLGRLLAAGYLRAPLVEDPGTLAVRGSLLDVWGPSSPLPVRLELDGDILISIKTFDPGDQRTRGTLEAVVLPPARELMLDPESVARARSVMRDRCDAVDWPSSKTRHLVDEVASGHAFFGADGFLPAFSPLEPLHRQLPADTIVVVEEPSPVAAALDATLDRAAADEIGKHGMPHFPLDELTCAAESVTAWLDERPALGLNVAPIAGGTGPFGTLAAPSRDGLTLAARPPDDLARALAAARGEKGATTGLGPLLERIRTWQTSGLRVTLTARTHVQAERIATMLKHRGLEVVIKGSSAIEAADGPSTVAIAIGPLRRGLIAPAEGIAWVTEGEIFGARSRESKASRPSEKKTQKLLEDLRSLALGDFVVHVEHGIGRYEGLIVREVGGQRLDLLVVEYAGGDRLYLPAYRLNLIQRYRGSDAAPKLDRLGGQSFAKTKSKARAKVRQMADELLKLYAERRSAVGIATPLIDDEYRAFEAAFPYDETDDQTRAIDEIGSDLEAARPMDRLVCGDVGFGKTEVAMRAAFRVAMAGRQVAVLCPTTVLVQQVKSTFERRMEGFPIRIEALSRFQSAAKQRETVLGLRNGTIDVVVGTHRMLSKDVHFKQLGLLVVDEEQRFGVAAKERLKSLKTDVDVLTLSATPIPRTLQMAVAGVRDLSLIATPPAERRAVRTIATKWDPTILRDAITRELARGGQVYFVWNRIAGLGERAQLLAELVPDARIAIAHGQMSEDALERVMLEFIAGEHDILCSTAIIENGLDIPRCNTIIIDRADQFGMSQLYQLRGRVGRSRERGYCYLVVPADLPIEARVRIEALQRYTELGSGFQVASLDLDLRGGGDLLGAEQSGTIAAIGLELFCSMLDEAVAELRGEPTTSEIDTELSFDVEALLADDYVTDVGVRLSLYKRLASARDRDEVARLAEEMEDRFGPPPEASRRLIELMALKTSLRRLRVLACEASATSVTLHLRDDTPFDGAKLAARIRGARGLWKLTPDMRLTRRTSPGERIANGIEAAERLIDETRDCLTGG
ncbi:MAG: transcription-repair coupling factor [Deltaproteobacteria bacterium]|nr:transcription-repair coupling factor [Deltaproteobacteria bacterium]